MENENSKKKKNTEKYGVRDQPTILERFWDFKHILIYTLKGNTLEQVVEQTRIRSSVPPLPCSLFPATLLYCGEARAHWLEPVVLVWGIVCWYMTNTRN